MSCSAVPPSPCHPAPRRVNTQNNDLWVPIFRAAEWFYRKRRSAGQNWLSCGDIETFLTGAGFETVDIRCKLHCPKSLFGIGRVVNALASVVPFAGRLASTQFIVARPTPDPGASFGKSATLVLTTRDERDNIEPIVRQISDVGVETQLLCG